MAIDVASMAEHIIDSFKAHNHKCKTNSLQVMDKVRHFAENRFAEGLLLYSSMGSNGAV